MIQIMRDLTMAATPWLIVFAATLAGLWLLLRIHKAGLLGCTSFFQLRRTTIAALFAVAAAATIIAQKDRMGGTGATGISPVTVPQTETTGVSPVASEGTNTFHLADIKVGTNTVTLAIAWPSGFFDVGTTIDLLAATSLVNAVWAWQSGHTVATGETNWTETVAATGGSCFYKAVVRDSLTDMDDPDGDGLPNAYELAYGKNPWLADSGTVPRLTVGGGGQFATLEAAFEESEAYSIVSLTSGVYQVNRDIQMPPHPVMVTCEDGYAVFSGATSRAMFLLGSGHESGHTLFRNLYLNLTSTNGMQAGFWCGGGLPWQGPGAAAAFENVHIRAPNPGVEYFGWLFYGHCDASAVIRGCCVNASGAEWIYAVLGDNPPPIVVESCTFVNFSSPSPRQRAAIGLRSTQADGAVSAMPTVTVSRVLFDVSFTNAWPLARFENADDFPVEMTDCIRPSEPVSSDFMPNLADNVHIVTSQVAWAGFPLVNSPAAMLGIGAFSPFPSDPSADTDGDGLLDFDEVYACGTDPWLADSDNDGIPDATEIFEDGTDPAAPRSFLQRLTVTVTNTATTTCLVRVAWGCLDTGWATNGLASFPKGFGETTYTNASSQGATCVKAYCDLNGNGAYDANDDILLVRPILPGSTTQVIFNFGDVDGDGVNDAQERADGTDPYDAKNFRMSVTVKITNNDNVSTVTNFLAYGFSATGWETNGITDFAYSPTKTSSNAFFITVTNGLFYVKCYRDLNRNGTYDYDVDPLDIYPIRGSHNNKEYAITIGDNDRDTVVDSVEFAEQTNSLDPNNYCFHMTSVVKDIFQTTNRLTVTATFGDDIVFGPSVVTGGTWRASFGHLTTTSRERIRLDFWDDANGNGILDADETKTSLYPAIAGHATTDYQLLPYGGFDADQNGLLDSWEIQTGLRAMPTRTAYEDTDSDGLTDFLEYVAGTDPLVPDGSNTLLSVMSRSVDDRLANKSADDSMDMFVGYAINGYSHVFEPHTNCWTYGADLTCCSMWNDNPILSACGPTQTTVTAISPRHVIYAAHFDYSTTEHSFRDVTTNSLATMPANQTYYFRGRSGQIYGRRLVGRKSIGGDIAIGLLDEALPTDDILPAYVLPTNFVNYIHDGKQVPFLTVDQQERASVRSCAGFNLLQVTEFTGLNMPIGDRPSFNKQAFIGGDSSSPKFFLVGDIPVLIGVLHKASGHGSFISQYFTEITRAMDELAPSSGYNLNVLDLSSFEMISPYEEK